MVATSIHIHPVNTEPCARHYVKCWNKTFVLWNLYDNEIINGFPVSVLQFFLTPIMWCFFRHQFWHLFGQLSGFQLPSNAIQFSHWPPGISVRLYTVRPSDTSYKCGTRLHTVLSDLTNLGVPMTHSPRFNNSVGQLTELGNMLYVYLFIIKDSQE